MASQEHRRKAAAQTGLYLVVIAAIAVVANLLGAKAYKRWDTTQTERYTLSTGSGRLIRGLNSPVQIDAYVKTGLPQLDAFVRDLTDLLKEYERAGGGKFKFTIIEPNTDELRAQAKEAGLTETPFGEANQTGEDQASITQGYMGLVLKYGSEKAVIPQIMQAEGLEFWITNKIREIRDKAENIKHRIGVVTGKDEFKLTDANLVPKQGEGGGGPTMQGIIEQAFPFYKLEDVDLKDGENAIDKDLVGLIITQPQKDYDEKELRRIDEFLMLGGKALVVYASAVTMKANDATMSATLSLHGLDKLLPGYGIKMNKDAVFDHGAQFRIGMPLQGGGFTYIRHPGIAHVVADPRLDSESEQAARHVLRWFLPHGRGDLPLPFQPHAGQVQATGRREGRGRRTHHASQQRRHVGHRRHEAARKLGAKAAARAARHRCGRRRQAEERVRGQPVGCGQGTRARTGRVPRARDLVERVLDQPVRVRGQRSGPRWPVPDVRRGGR